MMRYDISLRGFLNYLVEWSMAELIYPFQSGKVNGWSHNHGPHSLAYTRKGCIPVLVLPVPNAYTKFYCCLLMHSLTIVNPIMLHFSDNQPHRPKSRTVCNFDILLNFGVHIGDRKNLNWCTPFFCCKPVSKYQWLKKRVQLSLSFNYSIPVSI